MCKVVYAQLISVLCWEHLKNRRSVPWWWRMWWCGQVWSNCVVLQRCGTTTGQTEICSTRYRDFSV